LRSGFDLGGETCVDTGDDEWVGVGEDDSAFTCFCVIGGSSNRYYLSASSKKEVKTYYYP
jgi:hypothetical protein